ncbi:MAG: DUF84 family protein, partial [Thermoplasmatales archaeon]
TVENIGTVLAEDLMPIKSERIIKGEIDEYGRRKGTVRVILATENAEKIRGVKSALSMLLKKAAVETTRPIREFHSQPMGAEVFQGALGRLEGIEESYDYAIGIEAGIMQMGSEFYDFHVAAVKDSLGRLNYGISSGFPISLDILKGIREGHELDVEMNNLFGIKGSGQRLGAVYYLSKGLKKRRDLVEEALKSAFIERISESLPRIPK